jgi:ketosteroid isomerase-like protein
MQNKFAWVQRGTANMLTRRLCLGFLFGLLLLATSGCITPRGQATTTTNTTTTNPSEAEPPRRESLLEVDKAFARLAAQRGLAEAFYAYAAEDAVIFPAGELPVHGREAIRIAMSTGSQTQMRWEPRDAQISKDGDLGYTWGFFEIAGPGPDRQPSVRYGKYVTVWQRQPDGDWKYIVDIGNSGPPPRSDIE